MATTQSLQRRHKRSIKRNVQMAAIELLHRRARKIRRQRQAIGHLRQLRLPILLLMTQNISAQMLALPERVVTKLNGQHWKRCRLPHQRPTIECSQLLQEYANRPAISNHMMEGDLQHMVLRCQLYQTPFHQRPGTQIE